MGHQKREKYEGLIEKKRSSNQSNWILKGKQDDDSFYCISLITPIKGAYNLFVSENWCWEVNHRKNRLLRNTRFEEIGCVLLFIQMHVEFSFLSERNEQVSWNVQCTFSLPCSKHLFECWLLITVKKMITKFELGVSYAILDTCISAFDFSWISMKIYHRSQKLGRVDLSTVWYVLKFRISSVSAFLSNCMN